ncbi:MAG TPA: ABC transporter permease [Pyrinomonadaceae bacterium]|nr:ABC transporter permease [Pyrinomonadaceae bacterium]
MFKELQYAARALLKRPGFSLVAMLTLALGIGANTAIFSVVNAMLLRPLPLRDPERVVMIWGFLPKLAQAMDKAPNSAANFINLKAKSESFERLAAFRSWSWQSTNGTEPELLQGSRVSADFFEAVGASPVLGRAFTPEEDVPNRTPVAIISYGLWQRRFGGDENVIGKSIMLTGQSAMIVGVMPRGFHFPGGANMIPGLQFELQNDVWVPLAFTEQERQQHGNLNLAVIGRLKPGVSPLQGETELRAIQQGLPLGTIGYTLNVVPLHQQMVGNIRKPLLVLLAVVALVLLIACANIANLFLARATSRQKEIAIRATLGASRRRIVGQLLTESLLLALAGGAIGLLLAVWGNSLLVSLIPREVPRIDDVTLDARILLFTFAISIVTGLLFGLVPALQASRFDLNHSLKEGGRNTASGAGQNRLRGLLVVSQVAIALVLLIGAALLMKSFTRLLSVAPGFNPDNVLTLELQVANLPPSRYESQDEQTKFFEQVIGHLQSLPGVVSAGGVLSLPLSGAFESTDVILDGQPTGPGVQNPEADYTIVTPTYFSTLQIPLLQGRHFAAQDKPNAPLVILVNDVFAARVWPGQDPIGKRFRVGFEKEQREVVGVVGSIKQTTLAAEARPAMYLPHGQSPTNRLTVLVRTSGDPMSLGTAVREQVRAVDKDVPVTHVQTMETVLGASVGQQRFSMLLVGLFAGLALVLSAVGIYGVMAYSVSRRSHEIGVRMALGAGAGQVLKLVLKDGMSLAFAGIAVGLLGAFALTRLMASLLFGISAKDPMTFASVAAFLAAVALIACYIPARRATKVDPLIALRNE